MALAKKCDRCGVLYEHYLKIKDTDDKTPKYNSVNLYNNSSLGTALIDFGGATIGKKYDLCKECMYELVAWFKEG